MDLNNEYPAWLSTYISQHEGRVTYKDGWRVTHYETFYVKEKAGDIEIIHIGGKLTTTFISEHRDLE